MPQRCNTARAVLLPLICLLLTAGRATAQASRPATRPATAAASPDWLLHLPGIAGETGLDRRMLLGLRDGGYAGAIEVYDWTGVPGISALLARKHNEAQAAKVAEMVADRRRASPEARIVLTGHSGGTGILVWALERLPHDAWVDDVLLLSPALSPAYDLSAALRRVRGRAYAFSSPNDAIVLGAGTALFGTMDGRKVQSAGLIGFERPPDADEAAYERLVAMPYDRAWMRYDNIGSHIGSMARPFAAGVLAPIVRGEQAATRPATTPTTNPTR